jgi:hypothetical protein
MKRKVTLRVPKTLSVVYFIPVYILGLLLLFMEPKHKFEVLIDP